MRQLIPTLLVVCAAVAGAGVLEAQAGLAAARFDGRPRFREGLASGYFVWRDGQTWHVRWTSAEGEQAFSGHVRVTGGVLTSMARVDMDDERAVGTRKRRPRTGRSARGRARRPERGGEPGDTAVQRESASSIRWSASDGDGDVSGFDFTVSDRADRITFDLEIGGHVRPGTIEVGARNVRVDGGPLVAILH